MRHKFTLFALLLAGGTAAAQSTPAGTVIQNRATSFYDKPEGGQGRAESNVVLTQVRDVCGLTILPNGSVAAPAMTRTAVPGGVSVFPYTATSAANFDGNFRITAETVEGTAPVLTVWEDRNGNGTIDAGEPQVTPEGGLTLAAGQTKNLLVRAEVPVTQAAGPVYLNLVGSCSGGDSRDDNNVSLLKVGEIPNLPVEKTFNPVQVLPGGQTTVTASTVNTSDLPTQQVILEDNISGQLDRGLEYVAGSARAEGGRLEYLDAAGNWVASVPAQVRGLRVVADSLAPGARLRLSFVLRASERANGQDFRNVARAITSNRPTEGTSTLQVRSRPNVALGPVGNPTAPEDTPADTQTKALPPEGGEVCLDHTLKNTGDIQDVFRVTVDVPGAVLKDAAGKPLAQPITLAPGQETLVRVCYTVPKGAAPIAATITARGDRGTENKTVDYLRPQPALNKTVEAINPPVENGNLALALIGSEVTYRLTVTNTTGTALTGVQVRDRLPAAMDYVSSRPAGQLSGQQGAETVVWTIDELAPGATRELFVTARVSDRADQGAELTNTFDVCTTLFGSGNDQCVTSTPATVYTPIEIKVQKAPDRETILVGDRIRFTLTITNPSKTAALKPVEVFDRQANLDALEYIPGTATYAYGSENAQKLADPEIGTRSFPKTKFAGFPEDTNIDGVMQWTLPQLLPGQTAKLSYEMRVLPGAVQYDRLQNFVLVIGHQGGNRPGASDIAQAKATAVAQIMVERFKPIADILGTVFVDRNRNGIFDKDFDTPVERARVVLAGGRISLTDKFGRYSFLNVPMGTHAVRLDPNTTPYPPLVMPREGGLVGTQTAHVQGLTTIDFPLAPLGGDITVIRRTTVETGPLTIRKFVFSTPQGYVVNLYLDAAEATRSVHITDPLPAGAHLREGTNEWNGIVPAGQQVISYSFDYSGEPRTAVTDPQVDWR